MLAERSGDSWRTGVKLYGIETGVIVNLMTFGQRRILRRPIMSHNVIKKRVLAKVNRDFSTTVPGENHRK